MEATLSNLDADYIEKQIANIRDMNKSVYHSDDIAYDLTLGVWVVAQQLAEIAGYLRIRS